MSGFEPDLYRLVHRGNRGDVTFYLEECRDAASVLELGCGDGRVALPLARAGLAVTGVDIHPGMLAVARSRAADLHLTLVEGDMAAPPVTGPFDRILIPYCGLYCLEDDAAVSACFAAAAGLLAESGRFIFDAYAASDEPDSGDDAVIAGHIGTYADGSRNVEVYERSTHDRGARRFDVTYEHLIREPGGTRRSTYTLRHHYLPAPLLRELLTTAGLAVEHFWGGFDRRPYVAGESAHLVVRARPAGDRERPRVRSPRRAGS